MSKTFQKLLFFLFPPYEAELASKEIDKDNEKNRNAFQKKAKIFIDDLAVEKKTDLGEIEKRAHYIYEAEQKRKETLENKAIQYSAGFGIVVSIFSVFPVIVSKDLNTLLGIKIFLGIIYVLAIFHLIIAVFYSIKVRQVEGFGMLTVEGLLENGINRKSKSINKINEILNIINYNQSILIKKSNNLFVSEKMFIRGLLFISIAIILGGANLIFSQKFNTKDGCIIPDFEGLNQKRAESIIFELGLSPLIIDRYDTKGFSGEIIEQFPRADSILIPCKGEVTLITSKGQFPTLIPTLTSSPSPRPTISNTSYP
jgi:hypothetical protein